jgi:hypothetical protein
MEEPMKPGGIIMSKVLLSAIVTLVVSTPLFADHHNHKAGLQKKEMKKETKSQRDQQAEADAALKRVEAMTRAARDKQKDKSKKKK